MSKKIKTHFEQLLSYVPDLCSGRILDLGSGRGRFLIETAKAGVSNVFGVEPFLEYIEETNRKAMVANVVVNVQSGTAENIPFPDGYFKFANVCEVIEHVDNPDKLLTEVYRILSPNGKAYLSVPNRFGLKDSHFHLLFVNWLPRSWAHYFIGRLGRHKDYSGQVGKQSILDMHYFTFGGIKKLAESHGFRVLDMRQIKLDKLFGWPLRILIWPVYFIFRFIGFDSFHLLLIKNIK